MEFIGGVGSTFARGVARLFGLPVPAQNPPAAVVAPPPAAAQVQLDPQSTQIISLQVRLFMSILSGDRNREQTARSNLVTALSNNPRFRLPDAARMRYIEWQRFLDRRINLQRANLAGINQERLLLLPQVAFNPQAITELNRLRQIRDRSNEAISRSRRTHSQLQRFLDGNRP